MLHSVAWKTRWEYKSIARRIERYQRIIEFCNHLTCSPPPLSLAQEMTHPITDKIAENCFLVIFRNARHRKQLRPLGTGLALNRNFKFQNSPWLICWTKWKIYGAEICILNQSVTLVYIDKYSIYYTLLQTYSNVRNLVLCLVNTVVSVSARTNKNVSKVKVL